MTGPIDVRGARPGDTLAVEILDMRPRLPYGSNCAANWGLLYDEFGKERITIYELDGGADARVPGDRAPAVRLRLHTLARLRRAGRRDPDPIRRPASRSDARSACRCGRTSA